MAVPRIIFCNLKNDLPQCRKNPHSFHMPYGMGIMMDICKKNGVDFDFFDTYFQSNGTESFLEYYNENRHEVLLFSGIVGNYTYPYLKDVFAKIKKINPSATIILGGTITSIYPEILLGELQVDIIVIGEGEKTFGDLIDMNFDKTTVDSIKGIGYKRNGKIHINPPREPLASPLENETTNPLFGHRKALGLLTNYISTQKRFNRGFDISASRGCFGDCTFCKKVFDKPIRNFSAEYIVNLMKHIRGIYSIDKFSFMDENFVTNRSNFSRFLDLLAEHKMNVKWRIRARIDVIPYDLIDRMIDLGLYSLMVGLESANQAILDHYRKKLEISSYLDNLKYIAERDRLFVSIILGSPLESKESIQDNIDFVRYASLKKGDVTVGFLSVIPGTQLFEDCLESKIINSRRDYLLNYIGDFESIELNLTKLDNQILFKAKQDILDAAKDK